MNLTLLADPGNGGRLTWSVPPGFGTTLFLGRDMSHWTYFGDVTGVDAGDAAIPFLHDCGFARVKVWPLNAFR